MTFFELGLHSFDFDSLSLELTYAIQFIPITDGLYILLKPPQKKKSIHASDQPKVPSKLMDCLMADVPETNCPWSLSGPQFPQPTAIQQRYCYPKGDPLYSSQKGGALWTMVRRAVSKRSTLAFPRRLLNSQ